MRIALAQINPTLTDFEHNKNLIIDFVKRSKNRRADLVIFPECALFGYHPFDLLEQSLYVDRQLKTLSKLVKEIPQDIYVLIGVITKNKSKLGKKYFNSAILFKKNKIVKVFNKELLPTSDVFDEARFIEKGDLSNNYFTLNEHSFFVTICEDMWAWPDKKNQSSYKINPLKSVKRKKIDLIINISASPFYLNKLKEREYMAKKTSAHFKAPLAYVNLVGAQDEIIFDGSSFIIDKTGYKIEHSSSFTEDLIFYDLNSKTKGKIKRDSFKDPTATIHSALVLGLRDYCRKSNFNKVHFGLSGGIDSAVVACLAVDALGPSNVTAIALPGPFNKPESLELAKLLSQNLSIKFLELNITSAYETLKKEIDSTFGILQFSLVHENLQARLRGLLLMAYANNFNSLLLTTGNKSEYATGYSTLYGDMCGGLAPIADLTKRQVYDLANYYNLQQQLIPNEIIVRAPSAELRPGQKDQDSLPEYDQLDQAVINLVENCQSPKNQLEDWLFNTLMKSEFKRWQAAPILKMTKHSFGRGRRWPLAHK